MTVRPGKILVVDDLPENVEVLKEILALRGFSVMTATSGLEALAQVQKERPDLVLLDVQMPLMSGTRCASGSAPTRRAASCRS